jgi:hypothetical protein
MNFKMPKYNRHSTVKLAEVFQVMHEALNSLPHSNRRKPSRQPINGQAVGISSLRLQTFFNHGTTCSCCGLEASHFAIERNDADELRNSPYHLNLWGVNSEGEEVLFTHDHILARALGGKDNLSNTQTMCTICNFEKSIEEGKKAAELKKI